MPKQIQVRRGSGALPDLSSGEPAYDLDENVLSVGNPNNPPAGNVIIGTRINITVADPLPGDDVNDGYSVGAFWFNTVGGTIFACTDNSAGAAVWAQISN